MHPTTDTRHPTPDTRPPTPGAHSDQLRYLSAQIEQTQCALTELRHQRNMIIGLIANTEQFLDELRSQREAVLGDVHRELPKAMPTIVERLLGDMPQRLDPSGAASAATLPAGGEGPLSPAAPLPSDPEDPDDVRHDSMFQVVAH